MAETKASSKKTTKKTAPKAVKAPIKTKTAPKGNPEAKKGAWAVFATGGKQYLVYSGQRLKIEILKPSRTSGQEAYKEGDSLTFDNVLLTGSETDTVFGDPLIKGTAINATLKSIGRAKKIDVIKYKQKSRYFKKNGHRQPYFEIEIDSIK